jgi:hypothetical protein
MISATYSKTEDGLILSPGEMMSLRFISRVFFDFRVYGTSKLRERAVYIVYGLVVRMLAWQSYSLRLVKETTQKDDAFVSSYKVWMALVASIPSKMRANKLKTSTITSPLQS